MGWRLKRGREKAEMPHSITRRDLIRRRNFYGKEKVEI
jgi:hypothetical protein